MANMLTVKPARMSGELADAIVLSKENTRILRKHHQKLSGSDCMPCLPTINEIVGNNEPMGVGQGSVHN